MADLFDFQSTAAGTSTSGKAHRSSAASDGPVRTFLLGLTVPRRRRSSASTLANGLRDVENCFVAIVMYQS